MTNFSFCNKSLSTLLLYICSLDLYGVKIPFAPTVHESIYVDGLRLVSLHASGIHKISNICKEYASAHR